MNRRYYVSLNTIMIFLILSFSSYQIQGNYIETNGVCYSIEADPILFKDTIYDQSLTINWYESTSFHIDQLSISFNVGATITNTVDLRENGTLIITKLIEFTSWSSSQYSSSVSGTYYPISWQTLYFNEDKVQVGTSPYTSSTLTIHIDKNTGEVLYHSGPNNATYVGIEAEYDSIFVLPWLYVFVDILSPDVYHMFHTIDAPSLNNDLLCNDTEHWGVDDVVLEKFNVTGVDDDGEYTHVTIEAEPPEGVTFTEYTNRYKFEQQSGLLEHRVYTDKRVGYTWKYSRYLSDSINDIVDDGFPEVNGPDGINVNSTNPVNFTFTGFDVNFASYKFLENGVTVNSGANNDGMWNFTRTPILGNTTYSFTIYDTFGNSKTAETWVNYVEETETSYGFLIITAICTMSSTIFFIVSSIRKNIIIN